MVSRPGRRATRAGSPPARGRSRRDAEREGQPDPLYLRLVQPGQVGEEDRRRGGYRQPGPGACGGFPRLVWWEYGDRWCAGKSGRHGDRRRPWEAPMASSAVRTESVQAVRSRSGADGLDLMSPPVRCSGSSARTAPASPPRSGCCSVWPVRRAGRAWIFDADAADVAAAHRLIGARAGGCGVVAAADRRGDPGAARPDRPRRRRGLPGGVGGTVRVGSGPAGPAPTRRVTGRRWRWSRRSPPGRRCWSWTSRPAAWTR